MSTKNLLFSGMILFVLLSSFVMTLSFAKTSWVVWNQTYGGPNDDQARSVVVTSDGGYAVGGYTTSFGAGLEDFFLVKTDASGNIQWNQTYGGPDYDLAYSMVKTTDHGFALGGFTFSYGNGLADFWLVKTDSIGNKEWDQTFGGEGADRARSLIQTSDGGFALAGTTHSFGAKESDFLLVKTDYLGNMEWRRTYGSSDLESAYCMVETSDGGYALACHKHSDGGGYSYVWLVKTDASGTLEWNQKYGGKGGDRAVGLVETSGGGFALACHKYQGSSPEDPPDEWLPDFWLIKTDKLGNLEWDQTYGGEASDVISSVIETSDEGFALTGYTRSIGHGNDDFWLVKTDKFGNEEWDRFYGTSNHETAYSLIENSDSGYTLAGVKEIWQMTDQGSWEYQQQDFWIVKTNDQGIPEFPSWTILPIIGIVTVVVSIYRKKLHTTKQQN